MNISPDGVIVRFKTESEELFEWERLDRKANTVRILELDEWKRINASPPKKIIIQNNEQEVFIRTLTNIFRVGVLFDKVLVIFSWRNEHNLAPNESGKDPYAHSVSLEEMDVVGDYESEISPRVHTEPTQTRIKTPTSPILLPIALIADLMRHRRNRTLDEFISELLADYENHLEERVRDGFVAVLLSDSMLYRLQNIAHGRTINMVIRELYESYRDKTAEEVDPLHD